LQAVLSGPTARGELGFVHLQLQLLSSSAAPQLRISQQDP
jgi:hypothetical protein